MARYRESEMYAAAQYPLEIKMFFFFFFFYFPAMLSLGFFLLLLLLAGRLLFRHRQGSARLDCTLTRFTQLPSLLSFVG